MLSTTLGSRKIVKSLEQLKRDFVSSQRILTQYNTPQPLSTLQHYNQPCNVDTTNQKAEEHDAKNRHTFGKIVDYAKNMVISNVKYTNSHTDVRNLVSLINEAKSETDSRMYKHQAKFISRDVKRLHQLGLITKQISPNLTNKSIGSMINYATDCKKCPDTAPGRHHFHNDVEQAINKQIVAEFNAGYAYLSMACYFGRTDVSLLGTEAFFMGMFKEENDHAMALIKYQNLRGGKVKLFPISTVECSDWCSIHKALEVALEMEKLVQDKLVDLIKLAQKHDDIGTEELIISEFITEQERSIAELGVLLARANKVGTCGMSAFLFDKAMHEYIGGKK